MELTSPAYKVAAGRPAQLNTSGTARRRPTVPPPRLSSPSAARPKRTDDHAGSPRALTNRRRDSQQPVRLTQTVNHRPVAARHRLQNGGLPSTTRTWQAADTEAWRGQPRHGASAQLGAARYTGTALRTVRHDTTQNGRRGTARYCLRHSGTASCPVQRR